MLEIERLILVSTDERLNQQITDCLRSFAQNAIHLLQRSSLEQLDQVTLEEQKKAILLIDLSEVNQQQFEAIFADVTLPIITLTDDLQQGRDSLEWGATDYLEKSQLNPSLLEKSLRLSFQQYQKNQKAQKEIEFYQQLVDQLPQRIYTKDKQGKLTFANQALLETLGTNLENAKGLTVYDAYPLELAQKYDQDDQIILQTGQNIDVIENHQIPITQELRQVQVVKSPLYNKKREIIGTQGIFWDVSDRYQAEQALKRSEAQFRGLFEQVAVGMAIASTQGKFA